MAGKLIIVSAPSGSGKTTLVKHLLENLDELAFSISACNRSPRDNESSGKDYYFFSTDDFKQKIENGDFAEWEEVYPGRFYGTLKSEVNRLLDLGKSVVFDLDVVGGINLKKAYGENALAIYVMVSDLEEIANRLRNRNTEDEATFQTRIGKMRQEVEYAKQFDTIVLNDELDVAQADILSKVKAFLTE